MMQFGHPQSEDEPQNEYYLGAVDVEDQPPLDITPTPKDIWTPVLERRSRFTNKNRVPLAQFINPCSEKTPSNVNMGDIPLTFGHLRHPLEGARSRNIDLKH